MGLLAAVRTPLFSLGLLLAVSGCGGDARDAVQTFATAESVRPGVRIGDDVLSGRRRLVAGDHVKTDETGRASVTLDGGALVILAGRADLAITPDGAKLLAGRVWIDVEDGSSLALETEKGDLTARGAGIGVDASGVRTVVYVAQGEALARAGGSRALVRAGQSAVLSGGAARITNEALWDDWTGGLAVPGPRETGAEGVGEIAARLPGQEGEARWPLAIRNLDVRVRIAGDLAVTEVDQTFFNPASETVEGLYRIRTPEGAILQRFAVDRAGELVESVVKEQALARQQYQEQVYAGSTEDPALLEWEAPDLYRARIYPIEAGASRRIVIRYAQWIGRAGDVRTYRYPIGRGPRMQEMSIAVDLSDAGAKEIRANQGARVTRDEVSLYRSDFAPQADFWVDIVGETRSSSAARGFRAEHVAPLTMEHQPDTDEADYFFTQLFPMPEHVETPESLDVVLLVDLSAGTDATRLELARQFVEVVLRHLDERDRLSVVAADLGMHSIAGRPTRLEPADDAHKEAILDALAREPAGGATDLGTALADAAALLDPARPGAVVYVGDATPTVGELDLPALLARLGRLPRPPRLYGVAIGSEARLDLLEGLVRGGGLALRVEGRKEAAESALRILSHLSRPVLSDLKVELGSGIDRIYPRGAASVVVGEPFDVVGRVRDEVPDEIVVKGKSAGHAFEQRIRIRTETLDDSGDLRLRWASERLRQLLAEGGGREAIAEVGTRYGLLTPFTSFYVPSATDLANDPALREMLELRRAEEARRSGAQSLAPYPTGTTAAYGCNAEDRSASGSERVAVDIPAPAPPPVAAVPPAQDADEANGRMGPTGGAVATTGSSAAQPEEPADRSVTMPGAAPPAPAEPAPVAASRPSAEAEEHARRPMRRAIGGGGGGDDPLEDFDGERAGGGSGEGTIGLGNLDTIGRGGGGGSGSGYGSGAGRMRTITRGGGGGSGIAVDGSRDLAEEILEANDTRAARERSESHDVGSWWSASLATAADDEDRFAAQTTSIVVVTTDDDDTPHAPQRCSPASRQPLRARTQLWRERLGANPGVDGALSVWRRARGGCEVPGWRDRRALLSLMLSSAGGATQMVALWHAFDGDPGTQAFLRREILGRVQSAEDLRIVHQGLGEIGGVDWTAVETLLGKAPDLQKKVAVARDLLRRWPDDGRLEVRLFSLFEEAGELREARRLAAAIREDEYADARARTLVGEFYLRQHDEAAAKRAWSEIVEFAPFDPYARRWLGDLYRAAGWYSEAERQYETLAKLTPDDEGVQILLAAAAAGAGKVDEALRLEGRVASGSEPGSAGGNARWALLWSGVRLAAMRKEARDAHDADRLAKLAQRSNRSGVLREAGAFRAVLTWSHPDAGLELWTSFPEAPIARPEDLGSEYGIESWNVERLWPGAMQVEVRQTAEPGLRTVKADLWLIWNEGKQNERIEHRVLDLGKTKRAVAFRIADGSAAEVASPWAPPLDNGGVL
jgi:Ca-activated chloride channel family protein